MNLEQLLAHLRARNIGVSVAEGKLSIRADKGAMDPDTLAQMQAHKQALIELLQRDPQALARAEAPTAEARITPEMLTLVQLTQAQIDQVVSSVPRGVANVQDIYPLAPLQEGFLFHHLLHTEGDVYLDRNVLAFDTRERLDAFLGALQKVIDRHDILRSAMRWKDLPMPVQVVQREARLPVDEVVLPGQGNAVDELRELTDPRKTRLDLACAPLVAARIARDPQSGEWLLALLQHHIVSDHVTMEFIMAEVQLLMKGLDSHLPQALPYRNFIAQARAVPEAEHEAYFRKVLSDVTETTAPYGILDIQGAGGDVHERHLMLDAELAQAVRSCAAQLGVSAAVLFHAAWALVTGACAGKQDVVFGTVMSGRLQTSSSGGRVLGLFINALPLRATLAGVTARELVQQVQQALVELLAHEQAPLSLAQRCSGVPAPMPLYTSMLNYRHGDSRAASMRAADMNWDGIRLLTVGERNNFPLTMSVDALGEGFELEAQCTEGIDPDRVLRTMEAAVAGLVQALRTGGAQPAAAIDVLPAAERALLLQGFNDTARSQDRALLVPELLARCVDAKPEAIAYRDDEQALGHAELDRLSNRLAHQLVALGVGPGARVGVCLERGLRSVVALLAVLKAGGSYVPLEPAHPADRLAFIVGDAAPAVLVSQASLLPRLPATTLPTVQLDAQGGFEGAESQPAERLDLRARGGRTEDIAFVVYTSGSTGLPKGVGNTAAGLVNRLLWCQEEVLAGRVPVTAMRTSISFVDSITEALDTLCAGGCLVGFDTATALDSNAFAERVQRFGVNHLMMVPALLNHLQQAVPHTFAGIHTVMTSGERLPPEVVQRFKSAFPSVRLINTYGCSEVNGDATACECFAGADSPTATRAIIGRPISNVQLYVLDARLQPVPLGAVGEIYIGGCGVSPGYLNRPELTTERFIADPFHAGGVLYKTGDLGRFLPDGAVEYLGRNDFQVKLRGFRVELGEIEARLREHTAVRDCVVTARQAEGEEARLAAYVVPRQADDAANAADGLGFSLFYFGATTQGEADKYRLYLDSARFADEHGFEAIWTPERHFDSVAGLYPNPALLNASLASITRRVQLRAGSVVLPLQNAVRVAEDWSVLDNLSGGRVGVAIASGWHSRDFVLAPDAYETRHQVMFDGIRTIRSLWKGEAVALRDGAGNTAEVQVYPRPVQPELPIWITSAGSPQIFIEAGRQGAHLLTHLLGQTVEEVAEKIALYRDSLARHGFDPDSRRVTLMIHTFVGEDLQATLERARGPFKRYMLAHVGLLKSLSKTLTHAVDNTDEDNLDSLAEHAFRRYSQTASLIGTPQSCLPIVQQLREAGVDEFACLFDWMPVDEAYAGLAPLAALQALARQAPPSVRTLQRHLKAALPEYMVPATITFLEELPLTASGKVNRLALPDPSQAVEAVEAYDPPQGLEETTVARVWEEMLGRERIGRDGHFFELGGHSLLAVQMISHLGKLLGVEMPLRQLFAHPTVQGFAAALVAQSSAAQHPNLATIRKRGRQRPLFFVHPGEGEIGYARNLAPFIQQDIPVYGFAASGLLSGETPLTSIEEMAARYIKAMRHVQPQGPYRIAGWSAGGTIAYEIAHQLIASDAEVEFLAMIDTDADYSDLFEAEAGGTQIADPAQGFDRIAALLMLMPFRAPEPVREQVLRLASERDFDGMLAIYHAHEFVPKGVDGEILQRHLALRHALGIALYNYRPPALPIVATLFSASGESRTDASIGWSARIAPTALELVPVEGTHYSVVEEPHASALGKLISEALAGRRAAALPATPAHDPLVTIQDGGSSGRPPVFCIPGAGASVATFRELAQALGNDVPVYGLQARGLDGEQVPHLDVESAARACLKAIRRAFPSGPYQLLGHSFGGWIATELAQQLAAEGAEVASLVIVDSRVPAPREGTAARVSRAETLEQLVRLYDMRLPQPLGLKAADFAPLDDEAQLKLLHGRLAEAGLVSARTPMKALDGIVRVTQANLSTGYLPKAPYDGAAWLVNAAQSTTLAERTAGWRPHLPQARVHESPGNHVTLLSEQNAQALGQWLRTHVLAGTAVHS